MWIIEEVLAIIGVDIVLLELTVYLGSFSSKNLNSEKLASVVGAVQKLNQKKSFHELFFPSFSIIYR